MMQVDFDNVRARVEVMCFGYDGVDAVKSALLKGKTVSDNEVFFFFLLP